MSTTSLLALLMQVAYQTSGTPVMASEQVHTYDIAGVTSVELWNQIQQNGPTDTNGAHYTGDLHWTIRWNFWLHEDARGCRVERTVVAVDTVLTLPRWMNMRQGSNALQSDWDLFLSRLKEHEFGHRSNSTRAAQAVREAIDAVGGAPDCRLLEPRVNQAAKAAFDHWKQIDIDYDASTRHGETQGAVLH